MSYSLSPKKKKSKEETKKIVKKNLMLSHLTNFVLSEKR